MSSLMSDGFVDELLREETFSKIMTEEKNLGVSQKVLSPSRSTSSSSSKQGSRQVNVVGGGGGGDGVLPMSQ